MGIAIPLDADLQLSALRDSLANLKDAWAALRIVREALEQFGPVRLPDGLDFKDEAEVLTEAIWRFASRK